MFEKLFRGVPSQSGSVVSKYFRLVTCAGRFDILLARECASLVEVHCRSNVEEGHGSRRLYQGLLRPW